MLFGAWSLKDLEGRARTQHGPPVGECVHYCTALAPASSRMAARVSLFMVVPGPSKICLDEWLCDLQSEKKADSRGDIGPWYQLLIGAKTHNSMRKQLRHPNDCK
jgi:hypothetical protein